MLRDQKELRDKGCKNREITDGRRFLAQEKKVPGREEELEPAK